MSPDGAPRRGRRGAPRSEPPAAPAQEGSAAVLRDHRPACHHPRRRPLALHRGVRLASARGPDATPLGRAPPRRRMTRTHPRSAARAQHQRWDPAHGGARPTPSPARHPGISGSGAPSLDRVPDRRPVWQPTPALPRPFPHLVDTELRRCLEFGRRDQTASDVEDVHRPDPARDDPLFDPRRRDDQDVSPNIIRNEPRERSALSQRPATNPMLDCP